MITTEQTTVKVNGKEMTLEYYHSKFGDSITHVEEHQTYCERNNTERNEFLNLLKFFK